MGVRRYDVGSLMNSNSVQSIRNGLLIKSGSEIITDGGFLVKTEGGTGSIKANKDFVNGGKDIPLFDFYYICSNVVDASRRRQEQIVQAAFFLAHYELMKLLQTMKKANKDIKVIVIKKSETAKKEGDSEIFRGTFDYLLSFDFEFFGNFSILYATYLRVEMMGKQPEYRSSGKILLDFGVNPEGS
jgi:hypothetical protein